MDVYGTSLMSRMSHVSLKVVNTTLTTAMIMLTGKEALYMLMNHKCRVRSLLISLYVSQIIYLQKILSFDFLYNLDAHKLALF